jgi:hypothetical protein
MSELFQKILLNYRNLYPYFFYKNKAIEIIYRNNEIYQNNLPSYLYNMISLFQFNNRNIDKIYKINEKCELFYVYIEYKNEFINEIEKIINHINNAIDKKWLILFFIDEKYNIHNMMKNFQYNKIENFHLYVYINQ